MSRRFTKVAHQFMKWSPILIFTFAAFKSHNPWILIFVVIGRLILRVVSKSLLKEGIVIKERGGVNELRG